MHSLPIESHAHLALEDLTTPTIATRPQAQFILTLEAALESLSAGDEERERGTVYLSLELDYHLRFEVFIYVRLKCLLFSSTYVEWENCVSLAVWAKN